MRHPIQQCLPRLLLGLCLAGAGLPYRQPVAAETSPSEQELAQLNEAIAGIEAWLAQARQNLPEAEQRLQDAESRLAALTRDITESRQAIAASSDRQTALRQQQQDLAKQKQEQTRLISQLLRAAYMEGSQSTVKLVLNQQDPVQAARMLHYYRLLNEQRLAQLKEFEQTLAALDVTALELRKTTALLADEQRQRDRQLALLEQERQTRQLALDELSQAIGQRSNELLELQADRDTLQALIEEIQRAVEDLPVPGSQKPFVERRGQLPWPGTGPLLVRFGESYGNGELRRQGITIGSEAGAPVRAVHGGRVVFANWLRGSGLLIILDHGDGYLSLYGHNESLAREQGDRVEAGAVIASAGNSGGQQETGIYFEIRYNGRPQDPTEWLEPGN